jgi:beta-lactamase superfamily II metal-dependent hydrolase
MAHTIQPEDLIIHFLNVGFGDTILIEFPQDKDGKRSYGLVDCYNAKKTKKYLKELQKTRPGITQFKFICATHPHWDHIAGIDSLLNDKKYRPEEFWDSGFRHESKTYIKILNSLLLQNIKTRRISSGWEWYNGKVSITALAPSIRLRNRYATYGVDMNNASIVLRIEHHKENILTIKSLEYKGTSSVEAKREAGQSVIILTGDAEYDSWAHITDEYPKLERTPENKPLVKKMINYLSCSVLKISHHGSMHSTPLDVYEKIVPETAIISTKQETDSKTTNVQTLTRELFPHQLTITALEEIGAQIHTTDGSYETKNTGTTQPPGSIIVVLPPGGKPIIKKLIDTTEQIPNVINQI